jgi:hypothetical protein
LTLNLILETSDYDDLLQMPKVRRQPAIARADQIDMPGHK